MDAAGYKEENKTNGAKECEMSPYKPKMRWYNPKLGAYEWREVPPSDEEALELLDHYPGCERYADIYRGWREAGACIMAALIRAGESLEFRTPGDG